MDKMLHFEISTNLAQFQLLHCKTSVFAYLTREANKIQPNLVPARSKN